jgi:hypothetical protein
MAGTRDRIFAGEKALAKAPSIPLPAEIVARAKTGFTVPTEAWTDRRPLAAKRLASRGWSQAVLHGVA